MLWERHKLIHPEHPRKTSWDVTVCAVIIYSVLTVTYRIGFGGTEGMDVEGEWRVIDEIVFGVFVIDICLSFTTAYYDEQILVPQSETRFKLFSVSASRDS